MNETCKCKFCTARRSDPPGYVPATNARLMTPIPVEPIDWAELSAFGSGEPVVNERRDGDGLVVNERADGGIPTTGIDWTALSAFRPRL